MFNSINNRFQEESVGNQEEWSQILFHCIESQASMEERHQMLCAKEKFQNDLIRSMILKVRELQAENEALKQIAEDLISNCQTFQAIHQICNESAIPVVNQEICLQQTSITRYAPLEEINNATDDINAHKNSSKSETSDTSAISDGYGYQLWFQKRKRSRSDPVKMPVQFVNHNTNEIRSWIDNYQLSKIRKKRKYTRRSHTTTPASPSTDPDSPGEN
jgi:hypothetical protein